MSFGIIRESTWNRSSSRRSARLRRVRSSWIRRQVESLPRVDELEQRTLLASFSQLIDPNPNPGNQFGHSVVALSTGNIVVTSPFDDAGGTDAGAVYLFNGSTGALISTLRGSKAGDFVGSGGVTALSNGNFVISSPAWDNGSIVNAGAVTWGSGIAGVSGVISPSNSLVGSQTGDFVGNDGVTALTNGNYLVRSSPWDNGLVADAGAVTWAMVLPVSRPRLSLQQFGRFLGQ